MTCQKGVVHSFVYDQCVSLRTATSICCWCRYRRSSWYLDGESCPAFQCHTTNRCVGLCSGCWYWLLETTGAVKMVGEDNGTSICHSCPRYQVCPKCINLFWARLKLRFLMDSWLVSDLPLRPQSTCGIQPLSFVEWFMFAVNLEDSTSPPCMAKEEPSLQCVIIWGGMEKTV